MGFPALTNLVRGALVRSEIRGRVSGDWRRGSGAEGATTMRANVRSGNGRWREKAFAPSRSSRNSARNVPTHRRLRARGFMRNPKWAGLSAGR